MSTLTSMDGNTFSPLRFSGEALELLDQTLLPHEERWQRCHRPEQVAEAIRRLAVRGAPQIGVAAAYGLALAFAPGPVLADLETHFEATVELLGSTRPTAVNLRWALERGRIVFAARPSPADRAATFEWLVRWAQELHAADVATNRRMAEHGATLFPPNARVLTHCNTGALATAGIGTALGVIAEAFHQGKVAEVFADETRPLLQGARLTTWELGRLGIPHRLLADSAAATALARGMVDLVIVGADRIARNGDAANKIGTYPLAVLAARHGVPFYIAAPCSTVDPATPNGAAIPIEERAEEEVTSLFGHPVAPPGTRAFNPAFDVTPAELIAGIVTEEGVVRAPYDLTYNNPSRTA
ncbi:MAG: S-methyl-5-thioribose-1-phosphate isomerase [Thermoanaerobaculia bacterium]|nr:S-methyl-5-thioribose-1-phosphate isomerase [Thermoanaerobaculia bacterium]